MKYQTYCSFRSRIHAQYILQQRPASPLTPTTTARPPMPIVGLPPPTEWYCFFQAAVVAPPRVLQLSFNLKALQPTFVKCCTTTALPPAACPAARSHYTNDCCSITAALKTAGVLDRKHTRQSTEHAKHNLVSHSVLADIHMLSHDGYRTHTLHELAVPALHHTHAAILHHR